MRIMSCNIRYHGGDDGPNHWDHRKHLCIQVIRHHAPDVIGCQEVWRQQMDDLCAGLPEYAGYGVPDEPTNSNPVNAILYRRDRFTCEAQAAYWLSETPHVAGSKSWDSACIRLANWIRLTDNSTGTRFRFVNTHLDHVSQQAREQQARLINEDAAGYPQTFPQLLTGDMNCDQRNPAIQAFVDAGWVDTYAAVHGPEDPGNTFHGFAGDRHVDELGKIDWIFARGTVRVTDATVITGQRDGKFPSDHYFVSADVEPEWQG